MNVWQEQAKTLVKALGYVEAKRTAIQLRDVSSEGTASFAFHNAVVKALVEFATVGRVSP